MGHVVDIQTIKKLLPSYCRSGIALHSIKSVFIFNAKHNVFHDLHIIDKDVNGVVSRDEEDSQVASKLDNIETAFNILERATVISGYECKGELLLSMNSLTRL